MDAMQKQQAQESPENEGRWRQCGGGFDADSAGGTVGDSQPTVSQTLLFEEGRGSVLHVNREQAEQGEEHDPSHKTDQRMSPKPLPVDWDFWFFER